MLRIQMVRSLKNSSSPKKLAYGAEESATAKSAATAATRMAMATTSTPVIHCRSLGVSPCPAQRASDRRAAADTTSSGDSV